MNELTPTQCLALLSTARVGHLAVISEGDPYVAPISFVLIGEAIYVRTASGKRIEAMKANPRVCFEVSKMDDATGDWESVIVWSTAEFVDDDRTSQEVIAAFHDKYRDVLGSPLNPGRVVPEDIYVVRFPIEISEGRSSGSYFSMRSRPGRL
ncbi:MAG TPA: pyridoxamine 5'-phosphate oxidase family protein [Acidimicrobiia bacterium]|mgnify:CR=1 FL=1|jgi:nitroimidazol reductase NimA-like FMN-containing flavoprotein (pyridoxamine 5'-phosphate oxidase superfamily)|nr:pyridoxamine 5'-phosphate oxidase family protein [Acidimicrobiia bacterium]